ncbi:chromate resistance protein ChrB domain-containing protein [Amycolatopsis jejuensis]|uniref:chromate resistance protein ChrB domain-containing protein n=1 Tax=Amycolatopsis jejuensis TaxID=330084 RepID=UPI00068EF955|nr:chromate resistance protein ChrB domain-containing protein [Amycolatopsis jejuensis]
MHWVTRSHIHLDRVASPWLIRRFVDTSATFGFADEGERPPDGAVTYAMPGARFGAHDADGSTFRKILSGYALEVSELHRMAAVVDRGIALAQGKEGSALSADLEQAAVALAAFSEAMVVLRPDDAQNLRDSAPYYDALYLTLWATDCARPAFPSDIVARMAAYREAADWASLLPPW